MYQFGGWYMRWSSRLVHIWVQEIIQRVVLESTNA